MAISTSTLTPPLGMDWTSQELSSRMEWNFSHRPLWRMIEEADDEVKSFTLVTLKEYSLQWAPPETIPDDLDNSEDGDDDVDFEPFDTAKRIDLYTAAELDFEKGLKLIAELELAHPIPLRARTKWRFDAIMALCTECRNATGIMDPDRDSDPEDSEAEEAYLEETAYISDVERRNLPAALADHDHRKDMAKVSGIYGQIAQKYEA